MLQLSLSEHERLVLIAALGVTTIVATNKEHAGSNMRLMKKIYRSLASQRNLPSMPLPLQTAV